MSLSPQNEHFTKQVTQIQSSQATTSIPSLESNEELSQNAFHPRKNSSVRPNSPSSQIPELNFSDESVSCFASKDKEELTDFLSFEDFKEPSSVSSPFAVPKPPQFQHFPEKCDNLFAVEEREDDQHLKEDNTFPYEPATNALASISTTAGSSTSPPASSKKLFTRVVSPYLFNHNSQRWSHPTKVEDGLESNLESSKTITEKVQDRVLDWKTELRSLLHPNAGHLKLLHSAQENLSNFDRKTENCM